MIGNHYFDFVDYNEFFMSVRTKYRRVLREYIEYRYDDLMVYVNTFHPDVQWPLTNAEWHDVVESAIRVGIENDDGTSVRRAVLGLCCKYDRTMVRIDGDIIMFERYLSLPS